MKNVLDIKRVVLYLYIVIHQNKNYNERFKSWNVPFRYDCQFSRNVNPPISND